MLAAGAVLLLGLGIPRPAVGQTAELAPKPVEQRVSRVRFVGDLVFPREMLELRTRTKGNRRLLNIPGATWWLWLYQFGDAIGGRLGRGIRTTGEAPARLDSSVVAADVERLNLFYNLQGFRRARIAAVIDSSGGRNDTRVIFEVDPGPPTFVRSLRYNGLEAMAEETRNRLIEENLLGVTDSEGRFLGNSPRYSEPVLQEEGRRVLAFLRNSGYASVNRDSIHAIIVPSMPDSFDVIMDVRMGERFRFGDLSFQTVGSQAGSPLRTDTLRLLSDRGEPSFEIPGTIQGERKFDVRILERALRFSPGDWYDQSQLAATKRRLDAVGIFAFTEVRALAEAVDTLSGRPAIPHRFELQTRDRHRIQLEAFMLQRSGGFADSDNEVGTGLGITYSNLNLFGGGESFRLRTTGSVAADLGFQDGFTSAQWDVSGTLTYPYLTWPFRGLDGSLKLFDARTHISLGLLAARRDALRFVLRGRGNARFRLELRHSPVLTSFVDLLDLSLSNPDTLDGFLEVFLSDVLASIDDPVQQGQIVEDYTQPQINNALRYTLRSGRVDPFRRDEGHLYEGSIEIGGNLPYLLDRFVFSPGEVDNTLPGLPFFGGSDRDDQLIYRQYVRGAIDVRQYRSRGPRGVLALKGIVGAARPLGAANVIPFDRRFYSGGASSVRAWRLRELGPGGASLTDSVGVGGTNLLGGEIKLEASVEYRHLVIRRLFEAQWSLALFVDAGNVWAGSRSPGAEKARFRLDRFYREIGVGAGLGLRLGWEYLIVRLDLAYKVHDPLRRGDLLPDGFSSPVLQFGIGHTF